MRARDRDNVPPFAGARHGVERGLVGIGHVEGDKGARMLHRFAELPEGTFVWTRTDHDAYRLGRIDGPPREDDSAAARAVGIHQVRPATWSDRTFDADEVPPAVAATFARGGRNLQRTHDIEAERRTAELWEPAALANGRPDKVLQVTPSGESLWPRLAELPLTVESYELERVDPHTPQAFERWTTHIRLLGDGTDGLGEEISLPDDQEALHEAGSVLPLAGEWTLGSFCDHLSTIDQWPKEPEWEQMRFYRNWAYESAALDLALRQAGKRLHEVLELEPRPVRFVNSLSLGDPPNVEPSERRPPTMEPVRKRLALYPDLQLKVDSEPLWTADLIADLAATGAVESIDFKGLYGFEVLDVGGLELLYERVLETFPDVLLEDPHDLPEIAALLEPHVDRVSYDAPIHAVKDIEATPLPARTVNIKPSRAGSLRSLFELYAYCEANGLRMYGGGMGELGVGRGQVQLLASLFHGDSPNDVAPGGYNADDPPAGLPSSPLPAPAEPTGFRWGELVRARAAP